MTSVLLDVTDHIATITLNAPEARNAFVDTLREDMIRICAEVNADPRVRVAIVTGAGSAFSAGGDLKGMQRKLTAQPRALPHVIEQSFIQGIHRLTRSLYQLEVPSIAAINGPAIGVGLDLACMCDMRIAATTAQFASSFVRIGLVPADGGAWLLPRAIGHAAAAEMMFTGRTIDAAQALRWGLVSELLEPDQLMTRAREMAGHVASNANATLRLTKKLMRQADDLSLDAVLPISAAAQALAQYTPAHAEAVDAALSKRRPDFGDM